jgi:predicted small secreted protein
LYICRQCEALCANFLLTFDSGGLIPLKKTGRNPKSLMSRDYLNQKNMKKRGLKLVLLLAISFILTSCYTLTFSVGRGAVGGNVVTEKNHYLICGLVPLRTCDPAQMAGGSANYTVTVEHTFIDGLLSAITGGIYSPTTVTVTK